MPLTEKMLHIRQTYWRRVGHLTSMLLTVWFTMTFGVIFFARELSTFSIFGWPFSFYMAAQGLTLVYVLIVAAYARRMQCLDKMMKGESADAQ